MPRKSRLSGITAHAVQLQALLDEAAAAKDVDPQEARDLRLAAQYVRTAEALAKVALTR